MNCICGSRIDLKKQLFCNECIEKQKQKLRKIEDEEAARRPLDYDDMYDNDTSWCSDW